MATRTSSQSGNASSSSTWGGSALSNGDIVVIQNGHNVTFDASYSLGSKASGIGAAVTVQGGGTLTGSTGVTLTVAGFDTSTNKAIQVNQNGNLTPAAMTISVDAPSDWGTIIKCDGNLTCVGSTFTIPTGNFVWSNSASHNLGTISLYPHDKANNIYILKLNTASADDLGPISNSGGTGIGSFGDSSFTKVSGGFDGSTFHAVSSYANLASNGDFYLDHDKGVVYYKSSSATLTLSYSLKYGTWFSYGIVCTANNSQTAISITGQTTINYAGRTATAQDTEATQGGLMIDDKYALGLGHDSQGLTINGLVFNHCTRPLHNYQSDITGSTSAHHQVIQNITFNNCHYTSSQYAFANGLINHGYGSYVDYQNLVFNSFCPMYTSVARGSCTNVTMSGCTGAASDGTAHIVLGQTTPSCFSGGQDNSWSNNGVGTNGVPSAPLIGFGGTTDLCVMQNVGTSGHPNVYDSNYIRACHRVARLDNWMTVTNNYADRSYHHGIVHASRTGYISNYTCKNNTVANSADPGLDNVSPSGGGWTLGYNQTQWVDNVIIEHNTFDGSNRSIQFCDYENTIVGGTRLIIRNNILSNNQQGIRLEAANSTNFVSLALTQVDYNDDYNNATYTTNLKQGTFMMSGSEYNSGTRNCVGCYIFNPNYTLPASAKTLNLNVSGTSGTDKSIKADWGGGSQVEYVAFQGTLTSATNPGGGPATITKTGAGFPTTGSKLAGYWVMLVGGTGAGQYGMVIPDPSDDGSKLTVIPNTASGNWVTTPDNTTVFLIIKPHQTLTDASTGTIMCGMYVPSLTTTNGTYSDPNITIVKNYPGTSGANNGVDPQYISATNFTPKNTVLKGTASDGGDIGALPVQGQSASSSGSPTRRRHSSGMGSFSYHMPVHNHG